MDSIWSHSGVPDIRHVPIAIFFAFGFVAVRFVLDSFIYQRLATWLLSNGSAPIKLDEAKRGKIVKCSESLWKLTYYASVQAFVLATTYYEPWFRDRMEYFRGWPNQELKFSLKLFYMCQCGFYMYSIAALLTWETRRKDFSIMMSHHIVTTMLIGYSYITSFSRIGSIILALHDASDVFMEAAKVFKYSEKEVGASIFFGLFAISWLLLRLIFFPFWVIRTSSYEIREFLNLSNTYHCSLYYVFNTMLLMLLVFHIYWWILICAMVLRQLKNRGKVGEDIRSGKDVLLHFSKFEFQSGFFLLKKKKKKTGCSRRLPQGGRVDPKQQYDQKEKEKDKSGRGILLLARSLIDCRVYETDSFRSWVHIMEVRIAHGINSQVQIQVSSSIQLTKDCHMNHYDWIIG